MYDKLMCLNLDAGTIVAWKEYNPVSKLWSKIRQSRLPYNKFLLIDKKSQWLTSARVPKDVHIFEPIKKYSSTEKSVLLTISKDYEYKKDWDLVVTLVNIVRPNTLSKCENIENNRYYNEIDYSKRLVEYIYGVEQ